MSFTFPSRLPLAVLALLVLLAAAGAQQPLRVATWNVQSLGVPGSGDWNAALDSLQRIGADVVALEEVSSADAGNVALLAAQSGYSAFALAATSGTLSGGLHNAVLSTYPIVFSASHDAASLSGDPSANDMTRDILEVHVQLPTVAGVLGVFVVHLKSGSGDVNEFRRAIEIQRLSQVWNGFTAVHPGAPGVIAGDFNDDVGDGPFGTVFTTAPDPAQLPATWSLGSDVVLPLVYDPFVTFTAQGAQMADATQEDSTTLYVTRAASGRRLDYVFTSGNVQSNGDEVYNSVRDNGIDDPPLGNWLPKFGQPLTTGTSATASDHFPVFGDFALATATGPGPGGNPIIPGDVVVSEYMNNPSAVPDSDGEWIELFNTTGAAINLTGYVVRDQDTDTFVIPSLTIPSRGTVVLARNGDPLQNGGVNADLVWPAGSFQLANGADEIEIVHPSGTVLDSVVYDDGATFPDPDGHSVERLDVTALPWAGNFGESVSATPSGDFGTPGAPNSLGVSPLFTTLNVTGPLTPGSRAFLNVDGGPALAGHPYLLGASECTSPGFLLQVSGRVLDLCFTDLFYLSLTPGNPFFVGFGSNLDAFGHGFANLNIPNVPGLSGLTLYCSGVVLDPYAVEAVASVVDLRAVTIN